MNFETYKTIKGLQKMEFNTKETMLVLTHNITIFWCWGVTKQYNLDNKGLCLKVSGHFHKGYVIITLDWDDTYIITFISTWGKIKKSVDMVYFDDLVDIIDLHIETEKGLLK